MKANLPAYEKYEAEKARGAAGAEGNGNGVRQPKEKAEERKERERIERIDTLLAKAEGLASIAHRAYPPMRWIVKGVLPAGYAKLSGTTKIGKSWMVLQLASAVSLGLPFLGNPAYPAERGEVLLLALQISGRQIASRMELASILADDRCQVLHAFPQGTDALADVRRWKELHPACRLVLVDMMEQIRVRESQSEHSYAANVSEIAAWTRLALDLDLCIVGVTHDRKAPSGDFVTDSINSVGDSGSASVILSLKRSRGKADAVLHVTGWDVPDLELPLRFDPQSGWQLLEGTAAANRESIERAEILAVLRKAEAASAAGCASASSAAIRRSSAPAAGGSRWPTAAWPRERWALKPARESRSAAASMSPGASPRQRYWSAIASTASRRRSPPRSPPCRPGSRSRRPRRRGRCPPRKARRSTARYTA